MWTGYIGFLLHSHWTILDFTKVWHHCKCLQVLEWKNVQLEIKRHYPCSYWKTWTQKGITTKRQNPRDKLLTKHAIETLFSRQWLYAITKLNTSFHQLKFEKCCVALCSPCLSNTDKLDTFSKIVQCSTCLLLALCDKMPVTDRRGWFSCWCMLYGS